VKAVVTILALLFALNAGVASADERGATTVLAEGHCDVAARLIDGALDIQIGDDSTGTHRFLDVARTVFHVRPAAKITVPDDPNFAFLGPAGATVWILPQDQQAGLLWPGWNTQEVPAADVTRPVTWRLTGVDGPGGFWLFLVGALGDTTVLFNSTDGLPDTVPVPAGTHAHGNWGFDKEGVYRLTFEMSVTKKTGETVSDRATLAIAVGDVDPSTVVPGDGNPAPEPTANPTTPTTTTTAATVGGGNGTNADGGLARTGPGATVVLAVAGALLVGGGGALLLMPRHRRRVT
jgi:putative ABC transporter-associated repeat protein